MGDHSRHWRGALPFVLLRDQQVCPAAKLLDEMREQAAMSTLKIALATIAIVLFAAFATGSVIITYKLANKICRQNDMDFSLWHDRCVAR